MAKFLHSFVDEDEIELLQKFLHTALPAADNHIILRNDILLAFHKFLEDEENADNMRSAWRFLRKIQEILELEDRLVLLFRPRRASSRIYELNSEDPALRVLSVKEFLTLKERLIKPDLPFSYKPMELNLSPFYDYGPNLKDPATIGNGIMHLNRYMSASLFNQPEKWNRALYEFLKLHQLHGVQLLMDGEIIRSVEEMESSLEDAMDFLERCEWPEEISRVKAKLRTFGFLDGWGNTVERILETFNLLQDTFEQPDEGTLEEFLARIPMVSKVAMISPHGWFGQENVLGRPDTGGQVVYVLDQARALEQYLAEDLNLSGLAIDPKILIVTRLIAENEGTKSDIRMEKVHGTNNVWILRVPFVDQDGKEVPYWISRFKIWPYLGQYAVDAEKEIRKTLGGRPDLLIGNYSDGNLVAAQLSKSMGVIQCNIAHALEKSKYLFSDLYWEDFEHDYHFSVQFMADLISMNLANFIISSTQQEIIGTDQSIGQYESYQFFTMPGMMQVISGINLFHPRFNVIPPGVNNERYFPYDEKGRRYSKKKYNELKWMLFECEDEDCLGHLENPDLPPIFSLARLDRIKNLTGLAEAFGKNEKLRSRANLIIVASVLDPEKSKDAEEAAEIRKMHDVINHYNLHANIRWIGKMLAATDAGEIYRIMADMRGVFVQPALFEAFGLTILEAMHSGLPVFATQFGGPLEIIEHGKSGFLINPTDQEAMSEKLCAFVEETAGNPDYWQGFSRNGLKRAQTRFTWERHCRLLTRLTKVYGFWRYSISHDAKLRMSQYCHLLNHLFVRERGKNIR